MEKQSIYSKNSGGSSSSFKKNESNGFFFFSRKKKRNSILKKNKKHKQGIEIFGLNDESRRLNSYEFKKKRDKKKRNIYLWKIYCYFLTFWAPNSLLRLCGFKNKESQFAWREKIGFISCILYVCFIVFFLTMGYTRTMCNSKETQIKINQVDRNHLIINGKSYDLGTSKHPKAAGIDEGSNVLFDPINGGGMDASFLFQNVNGNCKNLIVPKPNCKIPYNDENEVAWYMPCRLFKQDGSDKPDFSFKYYDGWACHSSEAARKALYLLKSRGDVYFDWDNVRNKSRNLVVYSGYVLDLNLLNWIQKSDLDYPVIFDYLKDNDFRGKDISLLLTNSDERKIAKCLIEIIKVGNIDSETIGCITSTILLYVTLILISSVVFAKFVMACYFKFVICINQGANYVPTKFIVDKRNDLNDLSSQHNNNSLNNFKDFEVKPKVNYHFEKTNRQNVFYKSRMSLLNDKGDCSIVYDRNFKLPNPFKYVTYANQKHIVSKANEFKFSNNNKTSRSQLDMFEIGSTPHLRPFTSNNGFENNIYSSIDEFSRDIIHPKANIQPPIDYQPFGYPLAHAIILITCYSEDKKSLKITLDSVSTTDYPQSHKLIFVICDGIIKGTGNEMTTADFVISMMEDFLVPPEEVYPISYISVAKGSKRHNMAKIYAGFYKYTETNIPAIKQQRVPMITVVKCGTPEEKKFLKPGNRGKRDSQIILMHFLQSVMFDERMTKFEYEIFKSIWRLTGLMAEYYEVVLMVDADTNIETTSLTHMVTEMVKDPIIMGLCGETKISNKLQSWVTAIQVFEYYISHHQSKSFESVFGGVTCLPGCFCMYRIKAPKTKDGLWVPILANPDIVQRYSENLLDTLHMKNLLLLGEDRFLSSLMLKTFPRRKQVFMPKAVCKTIVPHEFKVLLSQRRRWINSTIHNLMELVLAHDLCGTFCFSMQFIVFIELIGTIVLPAIFSFTGYLVITSIVDKEIPYLSLILLAIIYGLPLALIFITLSSFSYVFYFFIYIMALPIWNLILPTYAFWKFDDFNWGKTRVISGDPKKENNIKIGEFDSSHIVMKHWKEFEWDMKNQNKNKIEKTNVEQAHEETYNLKNGNESCNSLFSY